MTDIELIIELGRLHEATSNIYLKDVYARLIIKIANPPLIISPPALGAHNPPTLESE